MITELRNQTQDSYSGPKWIDEIAEAVAAKLGAKGFEPATLQTDKDQRTLSLRDRVSAWEKSREPHRDSKREVGNRPNLVISAESQWLRPEQNELGDDGVIRPRKLPDYPDYGWNQSALSMSGYFHRVTRPIFHEGDFSPETPPGPNVPVAKGHKISW